MKHFLSVAKHINQLSFLSAPNVLNNWILFLGTCNAKKCEREFD